MMSNGPAQSWHGIRRGRIPILLWMSLLLSGCNHYADFTLPPLTTRTEPTLSLELASQPVLNRTTEHDILNPSVVFQAGQYWNYYSEFDGLAWHTALATSADGHSWTRRQRILSPDPHTWEGAYVAANGSVLFDRGTWWYWYQSGPRSLPQIGLATSTDGFRWTRQPAPVLSPGPRGSWDERGVADPYVLKLQGVFYVYYLGQNRAHQQQIGLARSGDGVHWTKLRSSPVLAMPLPGSKRADENGLGEPAVWQAEGWYWMLYTGRDANEHRALLAARSADGVHWTALNTFRGNALWDRVVVCDPTVLNENGHIRLWFGGGDQARPDENLNGQIGEGSVHLTLGNTPVRVP